LALETLIFNLGTFIKCSTFLEFFEFVGTLELSRKIQNLRTLELIVISAESMATRKLRKKRNILLFSDSGSGPYCVCSRQIRRRFRKVFYYGSET
jgi:hypothetical protein